MRLNNRGDWGWELELTTLDVGDLEYGSVCCASPALGGIKSVVCLRLESQAEESRARVDEDGSINVILPAQNKMPVTISPRNIEAAEGLMGIAGNIIIKAEAEVAVVQLIQRTV